MVKGHFSLNRQLYTMEKCGGQMCFHRNLLQDIYLNIYIYSYIQDDFTGSSGQRRA